MAWILFWVILGAFLFLLGVVLYAVFVAELGVVVRVGLMLLDGVPGSILIRIAWYLFHHPAGVKSRK